MFKEDRYTCSLKVSEWPKIPALFKFSFFCEMHKTSRKTRGLRQIQALMDCQNKSTTTKVTWPKTTWEDGACHIPFRCMKHVAIIGHPLIIYGR